MLSQQGKKKDGQWDNEKMNLEERIYTLSRCLGVFWNSDEMWSVYGHFCSQSAGLSD